MGLVDSGQIHSWPLDFDRAAQDGSAEQAVALGRWRRRRTATVAEPRRRITITRFRPRFRARVGLGERAHDDECI